VRETVQGLQRQELTLPHHLPGRRPTGASRRLNEDVTKQELGVRRWINDASWQRALEMLMGNPTVNIEGLVGGYTGPGGKTVLPHKAMIPSRSFT
jgi:hypothetical protein